MKAVGAMIVMVAGVVLRGRIVSHAVSGRRRAGGNRPRQKLDNGPLKIALMISGQGPAAVNPPAGRSAGTPGMEAAPPRMT